MIDPYKTLGLGREASAAEIKSAYRRLAKKHHPDLNPGNAERFKNITGAYDILSNPEKKKKFDDIENLEIMRNDLIMLINAGLSHSAAANYLSNKYKESKNKIYNLIKNK